MSSNLLSVLFISAIRTDSDEPYIYFNFQPHDPCVYDWLKEVCPAVKITRSAAALVNSQLISREQMLLDIARSGNKPPAFDAHFKPDDETGVQLLTMLILGRHVRATALRIRRTGSSYLQEWVDRNDLRELIDAQLELMGDDA